MKKEYLNKPIYRFVASVEAMELVNKVMEKQFNDDREKSIKNTEGI